MSSKSKEILEKYQLSSLLGFPLICLKITSFFNQNMRNTTQNTHLLIYVLNQSYPSLLTNFQVNNRKNKKHMPDSVLKAVLKMLTPGALSKSGHGSAQLDPSLSPMCVQGFSGFLEIQGACQSIQVTKFGMRAAQRVL